MNKLIFKTKSSVKYVTLEELSIYGKKIEKEQIVLVLENECFDIIKLDISKELDDDERELVIEGELEQKILDYNPVDYIEKEILLKDDENSEKILLILLKRETVNSLMEKYIDLVDLTFIVPFFLLGSFDEKKSFNENLVFDMCDNRGLFVVYNDGKIVEVESYYVGNEEIFSTESEKNNFLEKFQNILERFDKINKIYFFYKDSKIKEIFTDEICSKINIIFLEDYFGHPKEELNFIPKEYLDEIKSRNLKKFGIYMVLIVFSLKIFMFLVFSFLANKKEEKINRQNSEIAILVKNIYDTKETIETIDDYMEQINSLENIIKVKEIKFVGILSAIKEISNNNINIDYLEYNGKNKIQIKGTSKDDNSLYKFQQKIDRIWIFTNINHDYIKKESDYFKFQFDVGVKID